MKHNHLSSLDQNPQESFLKNEDRNPQESFLNSFQEQSSKEAPPISTLEEQIALLNQHHLFLWNQLATFPLSSYNYLSPNSFPFQNAEKSMAKEANTMNASAHDTLDKFENQKYFTENSLYLQSGTTSNEEFQKQEQQYPNFFLEPYLPISNSPLSLSEQSQISGDTTLNGISFLNKSSILSSSPQSLSNSTTLETKIDKKLDLCTEIVDTQSATNNEKGINQENGWCTIQDESKSSGTSVKKRKYCNRNEEIGEALSRKRQRQNKAAQKCRLKKVTELLTAINRAENAEKQVEELVKDRSIQYQTMEIMQNRILQLEDELKKFKDFYPNLSSFS